MHLWSHGIGMKEFIFYLNSQNSSKAMCINIMYVNKFAFMVYSFLHNWFSIGTMTLPILRIKKALFLMRTWGRVLLLCKCCKENMRLLRERCWL